MKRQGINRTLCTCGDWRDQHSPESVERCCMRCDCLVYIPDPTSCMMDTCELPARAIKSIFGPDWWVCEQHEQHERKTA